MTPIISLKIRTLIITLMIGVFGFNLTANGQSEKERTRLKLYAAKQPDGSKKLTAALLAGKGKDMHNVAGAEIEFSASGADTTILLAALSTDADGNAILFIDPGYRFPVDDEGKTMIEASYGGSDLYRSSSNDLEIFELTFELTFEIEDSVKYVYISANQISPEGESLPVEGLDINIGVARLFSILHIGEAETDEDGVASFEFPDDVPGDDDGTITIVTRIEDHDDYGTVEQRGDVEWGLPVSYELKSLSRQLWTDEAPLWMIISVFVILTGAWYHFFLSVYKLSKIRKIKESNT